MTIRDRARWAATDHSACEERINGLERELAAMTTERNSYKINASVARDELAAAKAEIAALREALEWVRNDINNCDWSCERCGHNYEMQDTDIALAVNRALGTAKEPE